jgi:beta-glucosidase
MGYRAQDAALPLFPFGFGLSYTTFDTAQLVVDGDGSCNVLVGVQVGNSGKQEGQEVVQVYVEGLLKAFTKLWIAPRQTQTCEVKLDKYAFSQWDVTRACWVAEARTYIIDVRKHALEVLESQAYTVKEELVWNGL